MKHKQDGYIVLITVLVLGLIATTVAAFLLLTGQNSSLSSIVVEGNVQARTAADGCAQLGLEAIQQNPTLTTPVNSSETLDATSKQTCTYTISGTSPNYTVAATGQSTNSHDKYIHNVTVVTNAVTPNVTTSSWTDTQ